MNGAPRRPNHLEIRTVQSILPGNEDRIFVHASISSFDPSDMNGASAIAAKSTTQCLGIFDTGASRTVISEGVANALDLTPIGKQTVHTANGTAIQNRHIINLCLPNKVILPRRIVTAAKLHDIYFLLGMDVINLGEFSITTHFGFKLVRFEVFAPIFLSPPSSPSISPLTT